VLFSFLKKNLRGQDLFSFFDDLGEMVMCNGNFKAFSVDDLRAFGLHWLHSLDISPAHLIVAWSLTEPNPHSSESAEYNTEVPLL